MTSSKRALTALATGALALPFLSAPAAYAVAPEPPAEQSVADFCATLPAGFDPFSDDEPNTFTAEIECIAFAGIAQGGPRGLPASQYAPAFTVPRDQMASFVARMIDTADELDTGDNIDALPGYDGSNAFSDVAAGNVHLGNINRLEAAGIVDGGPGGRPVDRYGPGIDVTRAQMASFVNRAIAFMTGTALSSANDYFSDDEAFQVHEPSINGIASRGVAVGDGRDVYRPGQPVQRDQMAGFLARALAALGEDDLIGQVSEDAANEPDSNERITVQPQGATGNRTITGVQANPDTSTADDRSFTVSGLVAGEEYRITLVTCASAVRNGAGDVVFADADNDSLADTGSPTTDIHSVNGAAPTNNAGEGTATSTAPVTNSAVATVPSSGTITFTIDGDTPQCVVPVVYENGFAGNTGAEGGGTSPRLELADDDTPAEVFGIGPQTTFTGESIQVSPDTTRTAAVVEGVDADPSDAVTYTVTGLLPGAEYRITVLAASSVDDTGARPVFSDTAGEDNLAETGTRAAVLQSVDGATPRNNTGAGTAFTDAPNAQSAVVIGSANGTASFVVEGVTAESVRPVVYRNGGGTGDGSPAQGGSSPRLELNDDGTARDPADLGGVFTLTR
jgi:hypothetical protein